MATFFPSVTANKASIAQRKVFPVPGKPYKKYKKKEKHKVPQSHVSLRYLKYFG